MSTQAIDIQSSQSSQNFNWYAFRRGVQDCIISNVITVAVCSSIFFALVCDIGAPNSCLTSRNIRIVSLGTSFIGAYPLATRKYFDLASSRSDEWRGFALGYLSTTAVLQGIVIGCLLPINYP